MAPKTGATSTTLSFAYPKNNVRSAESVSESAFKGQFIENLATDIAKQHVDSKPKDTVLQPAQPDRVGKIILEGNDPKDEKKILAAIGLTTGQVLQYPKVEAARTKLEKAGFAGAIVEIIPNELDAVFKDIRVKVEKPKR